MWWKLTALLVLTTALVFAAIPIRTHGVMFDPLLDPSPPRWSWDGALGDMYLTPTTVLLIIVILAVAGFVAAKVLRREW